MAKKSTSFSVDVECDGPIIAKHSMISFGMVHVTEELNETFYREIKPIGTEWVPDALAVSGFTREQTMEFMNPKQAMEECAHWVLSLVTKRPIFWADNLGDAAWMNWYFLTFVGSNPFGWSARRIGDVYCGIVKDGHAKWKHLRKTNHDHNALSDAMGNAEALLEIRKMGFKMGF